MIINFSKMIVLLSVLTVSRAYAEIYKYVDESGRITYSNIPTRGAKKLDFEPPPLSKAVGKPPKGTSNSVASPANFPKVDGSTQKKRDQTRYQILEEEYAAEQKLLAASKKALEEGEATRNGNEKNYQVYLDRVAKLREDVTVHEKNLEALKREMGNGK